MSIVKAVCQWTAGWHVAYKIPKGFILLRYEDKYRKNMAAALMKLNDYQREKEPRAIDLTLDVHYKKRTFGANALMWALYEIEANELNGGRRGPDSFTAEQIYDGDMKQFAPTIVVKVAPDGVDLLRRTYRMVEVKDGDDLKHVYAKIWVTSSHWTTKEMHDHLEMIFDRLSTAGVSVGDGADVSKYWMDWRQNLNDEKTMLHVEEYTPTGYRTLVKNCEACGRAVWHEDIGSSVAHIKAVGMGGPRESSYPGTDLMHLCDPCHAQYDNGQGRDKFLENWPHLKYKVETCLKRDGPLQGELMGVENEEV